MGEQEVLLTALRFDPVVVIIVVFADSSFLRASFQALIGSAARYNHEITHNTIVPVGQVVSEREMQIAEKNMSLAT